MMVTDDAVVEQIGKFEMRVCAGKEDGDPEQHRQRRIEALTQWLLAEWRLEHGEAGN